MRSALSIPLVVVAVGAVTPSWRELADVVFDDADDSLDDLVATYREFPRASVALALLLRGQPRRSLVDGIVAESAVYSVLQAGPEFRRWRAATPVRPPHPGDAEPRVRIVRDGHQLGIVLTRVHRRNALDARMRDELLDGLALARWDPEIREVIVSAEGPSFCAGGDLDEFGSFDDPATAHLVRLHRHVGRTIEGLGTRVVVRVHGGCIGSGMEIPAFADRVVASTDATFALPEIGLGLVPGAGGTASVTARVGRHRTAWLALTRRSIDAATALDWGVVDEIVASG